MKKKIHIHLGPHKTGSTAIQEYLKANSECLEQRYGIGVITTTLIRKLTAKFAVRDFTAAEDVARLLSDCCRDDGCENYIISSEDFSGDLPGRGAGKRPYPQLWKNIRTFEKAFHDFECRYYFFVRDQSEWLYSAYVQSLKHRKKFRSYEEFCSFIEHEDLWDNVLQKSQKMLGQRMHIIQFSNTVGDTSIERLCNAIGLLSQDSWPSVKMLQANASPNPKKVKLLELINQAQCSQNAVSVAKSALLQKIWPESSIPSKEVLPASEGNELEEKFDIPDELQPLWARAKRQIHTQLQPDLLPEIDSDWDTHRYNTIVHSGKFPSVSRQRMEDQRQILMYRFRELPEICYLIGLSISYLRRDTQHTKKATLVFQRLWSEEYPLLLALLPTRWLISSFQTFAEHGINSEQRLIGTAAFFFGNLMKAYEGERSMEGLPANGVYPHTQPQTDSGFSGLDRYSLGGTDLLVNTLSSLVALSNKDMIAGRVLQEFLLRVRNNNSVFSRHDNSRIHHNISIPQFSDCWSFYEEPK